MNSDKMLAILALAVMLTPLAFAIPERTREISPRVATTSLPQDVYRAPQIWGRRAYPDLSFVFPRR